MFFTKVGKSDREEIFAGAQSNGEVAPISPSRLRPEPERFDSFQTLGQASENETSDTKKHKGSSTLFRDGSHGQRGPLRPRLRSCVAAGAALRYGRGDDGHRPSRLTDDGVFPLQRGA